MTLAAIESGGIKNVHVIMCTWFYNSTLRFLSDDRFITQMHILLYFFCIFVLLRENLATFVSKNCKIITRQKAPQASTVITVNIPNQ